eukprot:8675_1
MYTYQSPIPYRCQIPKTSYLFSGNFCIMPHGSTDTCFHSFIYTAVVLVFAWPLYVYLLTKWYAHKNHFVIRNRWPKISLIVVACTIISQTLMAVESAFCIPNQLLNPISMGMTNVVQGLMYYRAHLLYVQTMKTRQCLRTMKQDNITSDHKRRCRNAPRFILYTILIASLLVVVCRYSDFNPPVYAVFVATLLFGVICLINIIRSKVKDSIGITKECMLQIATTFIMIVATAVCASLFPSLNYEINIVFGVLSNTCYGLSALFVAYNLIRRANVSNDAKSKTVRSRSPSAASLDSDGHPSPGHQSSGLSIANIDHIDETSNARIALPSASLNECLDKPLVLFLKDNVQNSTLFMEYLCECFALENMLFLERAIILHHLIKKYQKIDTAHAAHRCTDSDDGAKYTQSCYTLQFTHLAQIYNDIEAMIEKGCEHNDVGDSVMYKRGIVEVMKLIYRQFCSADSDTEINVAFDVRDSLRAIFEDNTEDAILNQFSSYEDLLMVFHEAIQVIMNLCVCIYEFQFRSYLRKNDGFTV